MGNTSPNKLKRYKKDKSLEKLKPLFTEGEMTLLYLIFINLEKRVKNQEINQKHFESIITMTGLWTDRLYILFDTNKSDNLSFSEFLAGIAKFTKGTLKEKITALFNLYDKNNNNFIDKDEFIKMLFNYPKEDIKDFINEIDTLVMNNKGFGNTGPFLKSMVSFKYNEGPKNIKSMKNLNYLNTLNNIDQEKKFHIFENGNINKKLKKKGVGSTVLYDTKTTKRLKRMLPTTINNMIKLVADIVFKKYATYNKLTLEGFTKWIEMHPKIIEYISKWFRPFLWKSFVNESGEKYLGFHKLKPVLETNLLIQKYHSIKKNSALAQIYDIFLFLFKKEDSKMPFLVIVLNNLDISFKDSKNKIYLNYEYYEYDRLKLKIKDEKTYKIWKDYIKKFSNYIIDKKYTIKGLIGKGKFSTVHSAQNNLTGKLYALKIIKKNNLTEKEKETLKNEEKIMRVLVHPNIIQFYESCETHDLYTYVIELVKGTDLFEYTIKKKYLSEKITSYIIKNLLEALYSIHSSGIIHRDLKPENIMLELNKKNEISKIKIIDFGFSIFKESIKKNTPRCGTKNYIAPEVLKGEDYGTQSDLFSLGVILFFLIRGELPFYSDEDYIVNKKTIEGDYDIDNDFFFDDISSECKDLIRKLLEPNPKKRINAMKASQHDFVVKGFLFGDGDKEKGNLKKNDFDIGKFI